MLITRDSTCGDESYIQCTADVPSDFCCPTSSTCMALAGNTTALCCPSGGNCARIEPIPCDISLEDKSQYPSAIVMTSALTGTLETCGTECCPFGFSCENGACILDSDQSAKPSTETIPSSSSSTFSFLTSSTIHTASGATSQAATTSGLSADKTSSAQSTASSVSRQGASTIPPKVLVPTVLAAVLAACAIGGVCYFGWKKFTLHQTSGSLKQIATPWALKTRPQDRFEKPELDASGDTARAQRRVWHELPAESEPMELPATPPSNLGTLWQRISIHPS